MKQVVVDVLEDNNIQRFEARRRQAARRRGMTLAGNRMPTSPGGGGHSTGTRHLPTPWLLITVVGSLGVVFLLAVFGAYEILREVFGQ